MKYLSKILFSIVCILLITSSCKKDDLSSTHCTGQHDQKTSEKVQAGSDKNMMTTNSNNSAYYNITSVNTGSVCGDAVVSDFYAGQNINIGSVSVSNSATHLIVTISTTGNWVMGHTHVYVGTLAGMPTTPNGNPKIGNFPSSTAHSPMVTTYTYYYELSTLDPCFIVATHAEAHLLDGSGTIVQSETAWANNTQNNTSGSWAGYINYCEQECEACDYETMSNAFYGGQTILVGSVDITNDETNLYVTFNTTGGWELAETHLYVGSLTGLPTNNANAPVPGQFPLQGAYVSGTTTDTYIIPLSSLPPCYIIAAHASVGQTNGEGELQTETAWSFGTEFPGTNRWGWYSSYCTQICATSTSGGTSTSQN